MTDPVTAALAQVIDDWQALAQQHPDMRELTFMTVADMITAVERVLRTEPREGSGAAPCVRLSDDSIQR